ncbi:MAG: TonB-dependent receptor [Casimicrobiaceae bacterium]|nr:TonB-dependent receptor [Casimicrobiaceae bacterium]
MAPVEVTGRNSGTEERRNASVAKIVITREDIEQYGDSNLGDVLRRLPGVTMSGRPGRPGPPQMRGMGGGFTQLLIDGQRVPPGFAIEQLAPDQIERIEILRAPTAETGARAIAGTINIVLREPLRQTTHDLRAAVSLERGRFSPEAGWTHQAVFSAAGSYNLSASVRAPRQITDTATISEHFELATGRPVLDQSGFGSTENENLHVFAQGRLQWRFGPGEMASVQLLGGTNSIQALSRGSLTQRLGATAPPYATRRGSSDTENYFRRLNLMWNTRLGEGLRLELQGGAGGFDSDQSSLAENFAGDGRRLLVQTTEAATRDRGQRLAGKLVQNTAGEPSHALTFGWELERVRRREDAVTLVNGRPQLAGLGSVFTASSLRWALYVQDEWDPLDNLSANLGLRYEEIRNRSADAADRFENVSRVLTPLGHLVWRFAAPRRDQIRLSLTQSYRPPTIQQLTTRPQLSANYPVPGPNLFTQPDRVGNPNLKPERANGLDLAYEQYLRAGGILSVNLFARQIRDLARNVTTLESVPWAEVPRYVNRPVNFTKATTVGLEFDGRFQLAELFDGLGALGRLAVKANAAVYSSRVSGVPGPDNRINEQPKFTANLGVDYRIPGTALALGGTLALTPAYETQLTETLRQRVSTRRVFDAYVLWNIDARTRLRLSASNLLPLEQITTSTLIEEGLRQLTQTRGRTDTSVALRLEMRL